MAGVTGLGHVGLFVKDMDKMIDFYTNVLGLTLTDRASDDWIVFFSAQPETEHHEFALARSQEETTDAQQVSFRVDSLAELKELYHQVQAAGCQFDRTVNHGIALGCYFRDPEDNRVEIYWQTGIDYPQPFGLPIDMEASDADLLKTIDDLEPRAGTGPHYYGKDVGKRLPAAQKV